MEVCKLEVCVLKIGELSRYFFVCLVASLLHCYDASLGVDDRWLM